MSKSMGCAACGQPITVSDDCLTRYYDCGNCRSLQLWPMPLRETNLAFETENVAQDMVETDKRREQYLNRRLALLKKPGHDGQQRLLDVGCATGRVMALAAARGWEVTGVEMSQSLALEARHANPRSEVLLGDILEIDVLQLGLFDAIVALDVIEHVLDPAEFLRRLKTVLRDGGQLLLHTPNARSLRSRLHGKNWNMRIAEYHFHLFSPQGLRTLLERSGFQVQQILTASGSGTEHGPKAVLARLKEEILGFGGLGNALVAVAETRESPATDK